MERRAGASPDLMLALLLAARPSREVGPWLGIRGFERVGKPPPARLRLSGPSRRRVPTGVPSASTRASPWPPVAFLAKRRRVCDNLATRWRLHVGKPPWSGGEAAAEMGQFQTATLQ